MAHRDRKTRLVSERGQPGLERPGAVAVGPAGVRGDQQPGRGRIVGPTPGVPPASDRFDRERRGVMAGADVDPAGVPRHVVDAVRGDLAEIGIGEVVGVDPHRLALGRPLAPRVLELPDDLLLFRVHAGHRVSTDLMTLNLIIDVPELCIPVRVLRALQDLDVALQRETLGVQQVRHGARRHRPTGSGQLRGQVTGRLGRPAQRRHRIPPHVRLDQLQQRHHQPGIDIGQPRTAPAGPTHPATRLGTARQLGSPGRHQIHTDPRRPRHQADPAVTQRPRLSAQHQPTLPLVQMRPHLSELHRQHRLGPASNTHTD
jgi:hypothetical protein